MLEEGVNGAHYYYSDHAYVHVLDFLYITYPGAALRHATHTVHWPFEYVSYETLQKLGLLSTARTDSDQRHSSEYFALIGSFFLVGLEVFIRIFTLLLRE